MKIVSRVQLHHDTYRLFKLISLKFIRKCRRTSSRKHTVSQKFRWIFSAGNDCWTAASAATVDIMTRNTFSSGQKYRHRKHPAILDRDVGLFYPADLDAWIAVMPRRSASAAADAAADADERSYYSWRQSVSDSSARYRPENHRSESVFYRKTGSRERTRICLTLARPAARALNSFTEA